MNARLEIDIDKIISNIELIRKNKEVCLPVKGNCYGFGLDLIQIFIERGYTFFAVSTLEEAKYVRKLNKKVKVLIFSAIFPEDLKVVREYNLLFTVYDFEILNTLNPEDQFHLKIDIGMGRLGFQENELEKVKDVIVEKGLNPEGIYTHLPKCDDEDSSLKKIEQFEEMTKFFQSNNISFEYIHIYNGLGALKYNTTFDNLIRPGLAIYGYYGSEIIKNKFTYPLKETASLKVRISHVKNYKGEIGYDGIEKVDGHILTLPIGYHDGIGRLYEGYKISDVGKIVGKICMCQFMIGACDSNFKKGDYVEIFGQNNSIYDLSTYANISVYEIFSCLSDRIERIYN